MSSSIFLSIIIPCYNEEQRIGKTLAIIGDYLNKQSYTSEVIVVDNGSSDMTNEVVQSYMDKVPNLQILSRKSHGKGWAVREGMLAASGQYRLFTDADNSTDISQIEKLLPFAQEGYEVVISSRRIDGAVITHPQPWYREILGNMFAFVVRAIMPLGIKDTQNGFKLFTKRASERIFPHQTIFYWAFDVEVLALAHQFGYRIKEVPIVWVNDEGSKMSIKGMIRMLFEVIITRLHMMTRTYVKGEKVKPIPQIESY